MAVRSELPRGYNAVGGFFFFGFVMASLAGVTLLWRGTPLDRMWALNPSAYRELAPFGRAIGIPFLVLSAALFAAGTGWFRRERWGWYLAVAIIAAQAAGDFISMFLGHAMRGATGGAIACALLFYLSRQPIRGVFNNR